ncbi:mRNA-decapping enzyme-like protein [Musa troglodytarum]|uniref:mRNA-decapping enzyme-like protein n=1 Tax=Musa troglodytarum TaxID=320322 RepID=A0A9E7LDD2_9LILI|nr:mRNA-decapping enzyme-like protein [Musa troglodytarum]
MAILYAVVARGTSVLAEFAAVTGNVGAVARRILEKLPPYSDSRLCFSQDRYIFHVLRSDGITFLCMANDTFGSESKASALSIHLYCLCAKTDEIDEVLIRPGYRAGLRVFICYVVGRVPFLYLEDIHMRFMKNYGRVAHSALAYAMNDEFSRVLHQQMEFFSSNPSADTLNRARGEIHTIMVDNVEKILDRGDRIALLVDKTATMQDSAFHFRKQSRRLRQALWMKNAKLLAVLTLAIVLLLYVIIAACCGGITLPSWNTLLGGAFSSIEERKRDFQFGESSENVLSPMFFSSDSPTPSLAGPTQPLISYSVERRVDVKRVSKILLFELLIRVSPRASRMTQNGKLMPNLDQQSTKILNLTVLQRIDPFVEEILMTAAHVTLYEFNIELNQWSRKDVEGSLFVVKRNTQPRFQFIVMNRRNTDNLVEDLLGDFEYEVQVPYLLYRNAAQEVNGIWFYNSHDCESVANLFSRILNAYSKVPPKPKVSSKSEFEELEAVPTSSVIEGPLEPTATSAATSITDVPDDSFVNYFSNAMNIGNATNAAIGVQPPIASTTVSATSHAVSPSAVPTVQSTLTIPASSTLIPPLDVLESNSGNSNRAANLVKPSFFSPVLSSSVSAIPPVSSSIPAAPPLHPPVTMQRPYGTLLLQPFPPPAPSASLTPTPNYGPVITKDKVRDALLKLVQVSFFPFAESFAFLVYAFLKLMK